MLAQMPMARGNTHPSAQGSGADWRDLTLYLQTRRTILRSDALFLNDAAQLRNQLVQGEIVALDREVVIRLAQLGEAIFLQLDPDYRRPGPGRAERRSAAPTAPGAGRSGPPSASGPGPGLSDHAVPAYRAHPYHCPAGPRRCPAAFRSAGRASRCRRAAVPPAQPLPAYCPNCGREVEPGDLSLPRCGASFVWSGRAPAASYSARRRSRAPPVARLVWPLHGPVTGAPAMSRARAAPPSHFQSYRAALRPLPGSAQRPGASFCANCGSRLTARAGAVLAVGCRLQARAVYNSAALGAGRWGGGLCGQRPSARRAAMRG